MDMSSELVNANVGHGNKEIVKAIKEQADKYCFLSPGFAVEPRAILAKMVIERMPDNMGKVFFTNGGADANENAIKMARLYTGRYKIMSGTAAITVRPSAPAISAANRGVTL